jgi:hypothetical protein
MYLKTFWTLFVKTVLEILEAKANCFNFSTLWANSHREKRVFITGNPCSHCRVLVSLQVFPCKPLYFPVRDCSVQGRNTCGIHFYIYLFSWFIKEKVCVPKTLQILCILCSTSMTHTGNSCTFLCSLLRRAMSKAWKKNLFAPSTCHYFKREQVANTYIPSHLCRKKKIFSNFSCMFLNPNIFFQFES